LIDALLDTEEYADYWAMKWGDCCASKRSTDQLWPNGVQAIPVDPDSIRTHAYTVRPATADLERQQLRDPPVNY
jgi:hypothetical protein